MGTIISGGFIVSIKKLPTEKQFGFESGTILAKICWENGTILLYADWFSILLILLIASSSDS